MDFSRFKPHDDDPLHSQIRAWLLAELDAYELESQLPTDRALAKGLGVAPLTVKRVMGDLERDGYVVRRRGAGTFLHSREKHVHAERPLAGENGELILAYPNYFSHEYWARAYLAEAAALKNGQSLLEFKMNPSTTCDALLDFARGRANLRGLMIAPVPGSIDREIFAKLDGLGVPVVIFAASAFLDEGEHIYTVTPDWHAAGYRKIAYLLDHGHERIAYIAHEPGGQDNGANLEGMKQCLRNHDYPVRNLMYLPQGALPWQDAIAAAYRLCGELLDRAASSALLVDSLSGAMAALRFCRENGFAVPEDLSLLCGGPLSPYEDALYPAVTSVYSPIETQMDAAFAVLSGSEAPETKAVHTELVLDEGASVADLAQDRQGAEDRIFTLEP